MHDRTASIRKFDQGITAVDAEYVEPNFDACHLIVEDGRVAFVDTGTNNSVPFLLDALRQQNIDVADVDYVFVTHVHLDHAGGAGELLRHLPNAKAVLHPRGAPHMLDPSRLIEGTIGVYGEDKFRELYGGVTPIDADRLIVVHDLQQFKLGGRPLECFYTEGHARHHYCVWDAQSSSVFTGDSFGVSYRGLDTNLGEFIIPSSTPIDFDPAEAHKSVDRIMAYGPRQAFVTHYSRIGISERLASDLHGGIDSYVELAKNHANSANRANSISAGMFRYFAERLEQHGFKGNDQEIHAILDYDIRINTMGLEVWLDRTAKLK